MGGSWPIRFIARWAWAEMRSLRFVPRLRRVSSSHWEARSLSSAPPVDPLLIMVRTVVQIDTSTSRGIAWRGIAECAISILLRWLRPLVILLLLSAILDLCCMPLSSTLQARVFYSNVAAGGCSQVCVRRVRRVRRIHLESVGLRCCIPHSRGTACHSWCGAMLRLDGRKGAVFISALASSRGTG